MRLFFTERTIFTGFELIIFALDVRALLHMIFLVQFGINEHL